MLYIIPIIVLDITLEISFRFCRASSCRIVFNNRMHKRYYINISVPCYPNSHPVTPITPDPPQTELSSPSSYSHTLQQCHISHPNPSKQKKNLRLTPIPKHIRRNQENRQRHDRRRPSAFTTQLASLFPHIHIHTPVSTRSNPSK